MRLSTEQRQGILDIVHDAFGEAAQVCLFGSRVDDSLHGGDVDLLIDTPNKPALAAEITLAARLEEYLGEPVDIITTWPDRKKKPIVRIAELTGVEL